MDEVQFWGTSPLKIRSKYKSILIIHLQIVLVMIAFSNHFLVLPCPKWGILIHLSHTKMRKRISKKPPPIPKMKTRSSGIRITGESTPMEEDVHHRRSISHCHSQNPDAGGENDKGKGMCTGMEIESDSSEQSLDDVISPGELNLANTFISTLQSMPVSNPNETSFMNTTVPDLTNLPPQFNPPNSQIGTTPLFFSQFNLESNLFDTIATNPYHNFLEPNDLNKLAPLIAQLNEMLNTSKAALFTIDSTLRFAGEMLSLAKDISLRLSRTCSSSENNENLIIAKLESMTNKFDAAFTEMNDKLHSQDEMIESMRNNQKHMMSKQDEIIAEQEQQHYFLTDLETVIQGVHDHLVPSIPEPNQVAPLVFTFMSPGPGPSHS